MEQVNNIPINLDTGIDSFLLFGDSLQFLAVPFMTSSTIVNFYDASSPESLILLYSVPSAFPSYVYSMDVSLDNKLVVCDNN